MLSWPDIINPSFDLQEDPEDAVIRNDLDAGYQKTRPRYTRNRTTWKDLTWNCMRAADKAKLDDFYRNKIGNGADMFSWTHPQSGTRYTVRFVGAPHFVLKAPNIWSVQLTLQEV